MNTTELKQEIESLNDQIKDIEKQCEPDSYKLNELRERINAVQSDRDKDIQSLKHWKEKLLMALAEGSNTDWSTRRIYKLEIIVSVPVDKIQEILRDKIMPFQTQIQNTRRPMGNIDRQIKLFEKAITLRLMVDDGKMLNQLSDHFIRNLRYTQFEFDECLKLAA